MTRMTADTAPGQRYLHEIVDLKRYPLEEPASPAWHDATVAVRQALHGDDCCVLRGFVPEQRRKAVRRECAFVAGQAYHDETPVNVYDEAPDLTQPPGHPARRAATRGSAVVARDSIPTAFLIHRLYKSSYFRSFLAACLGAPAVYPLGDPLAGLVVNVLPPGGERPWHFDFSDFTVILLTQEPEGGGLLEYCPGLRRAGDENLDAVTAVLDGHAGERIKRVPLHAGDLLLLRGHSALHRVSPVVGDRPRYAVVFSYCDRPSVTGSPERTMQLFGRLNAVL